MADELLAVPDLQEARPARLVVQESQAIPVYGVFEQSPGDQCKRSLGGSCDGLARAFLGEL
jgi:hypothetical protein